MRAVVTPSDFFGEHVPQRIIGIECETNVQLAGGYNLEDYIKSYAIGKTGHISVRGFLDNGYRMYTDVGHLEIATPECLGPRQAAIADCAGIVLLSSVVEASGKPHGGLHRVTGTEIDAKEMTSGYHENYMFPRILEKSSLFDTVMASHLASRVWAGSGMLRESGFELYQKVSGIGGAPIERQILRRTTHGQKPMAMIPPRARDIDTVGNPDWARLEVRFADAGLSPTMRYLSFATTSLVLRIIEHQGIVDLEDLVGFSFKNHAQAARMFSGDLSLSKVTETENGSEISAINYQEMLAETAYNIAQEVELPPDEQQAIELWQGMITDLTDANLESGAYGNLLKTSDFAARHKYLSTRFEGSLSSQNPYAERSSRFWDRVLPAGGGTTYWGKVGSDYITAKEIQQFPDTAPPTRARVRGGKIKHYTSTGIEWVNWSSVRNTKSVTELMDDPYRFTSY